MCFIQRCPLLIWVSYINITITSSLHHSSVTYTVFLGAHFPGLVWSSPTRWRGGNLAAGLPLCRWRGIGTDHRVSVGTERRRHGLLAAFSQHYNWFTHTFPPSLSFLSMQLGTRESWQIFYPPEFEIVEFFSTRPKIGAHLCKPHPFVIGFRVRFLSHTSQLQQRNLVLEVNFLTRALLVLFNKLHSFFCCWRV